MQLPHGCSCVVGLNDVALSTKLFLNFLDPPLIRISTESIQVANSIHVIADIN